VYLAGSWTRKKLHEEFLAKRAIDALIYNCVVISMDKTTGTGLEDLSTYFHEFARNIQNV